MNRFETLQEIIQKRRSIKPAELNGKKIDDEIIKQLLHLADWAPTHARTEPWRFVVFSEEAVQEFCAAHAELYKANTPEDKFTSAKYEGLIHIADKASHIIAVYMKRLPEAKSVLSETLDQLALDGSQDSRNQRAVGRLRAAQTLLLRWIARRRLLRRKGSPYDQRRMGRLE